MTELPSLPALLLVLIVGWASSGTAQTPTADEGVFRITRDAAVIGREEFTIRRGRRSADGGFTISAAALYPPNRPTVRLVAVLEFGPDSQPTTGQIDVDDGERRSILVAIAAGRVTVRTVTTRGESARQYPATRFTTIVDDAFVASLALLPSRPSASIAMIEPRKLRRTLVDMRDRGLDQTLIEGHMRTLRHVTLGSGSEAKHLWYDESGRLQKVHVPASGLTAVRTHRGNP